MEHDVFISYSRKDEELVKKIRAALTQANISYWIDKEEIKRGTSYAKAISQAVYNSKILLFIWSEHSNNSENTANEISLALEFEKNIVPFKISKKLGPSDMTYHLLKLDRIDACPFESHHIQELVASIAQCLGRGLTPSSTTSGTSGSTPISNTFTSSSTASNTSKMETHKFDNGSYTGEMADGKFNGQGTYCWTDYNPQNEKTIFPKRKRKVRSRKDQNESVQFPDTRTKIKQRLSALQMVFKRCFFL